MKQSLQQKQVLPPCIPVMTHSFRVLLSNHTLFRSKWTRAISCRHLRSRRRSRKRRCSRSYLVFVHSSAKSLPYLPLTAGLTDTRLAARIMSSEPAKQMSLAMHALGRFGSAADCASVVDLLLDCSRCCFSCTACSACSRVFNIIRRNQTAFARASSSNCRSLPCFSDCI